MKKLISLWSPLLGSLALLLACLWPARSQAQGAAGSPADAAVAVPSPAIPKAAMLRSGWRPLLDEKLTAWELWMGVPHRTVVGLPEGTPTSATAHDGTPLGLNNDPSMFFPSGWRRANRCCASPAKSLAA